MSRFPQNHPALQSKRIVSIVTHGPGWDVKHSCGHVVWMEQKPTVAFLLCATCLGAALRERDRKRALVGGAR